MKKINNAASANNLVGFMEERDYASRFDFSKAGREGRILFRAEGAALNS